jgi:hypothetical protein
MAENILSIDYSAPPSPDEQPALVAASLAVLLVASLLQTLLRVSSRNGSAPAYVLRWSDSEFWIGWTVSLILAFTLLYLGSAPELDPTRSGVLIGCLVASLAVLPVYARCMGIDPATGNMRKVRGVVVTNIISLSIVIPALFAGVNLYSRA